MTYKVFVDGHEGTTGLAIFDCLAARTDIEVLRIDEAKRKDPEARRTLLNAADIAFLCLPDAAAKESAALVTNPNTCLIDASTAHRVDPAWVYGLPELSPAQRTAIRQSKRISNTGCHASGFILLMAPLVSAGIVSREQVISCFSITGYSGGGKKMIEQFEAGGNPKLLSPRPYALEQQHKHLPEMAKYAGLHHAPLFSPIVGNFYKGMGVTVPLALSQLAKKVSLQEIQAVYAAHYAGERYVQALPLGAESNVDGHAFDVQGCNDTNRVDIAVFGNAERFTVMARLDNLGKGASGAAVQCMNIHLGIDETLGLNA